MIPILHMDSVPSDPEVIELYQWAIGVLGGAVCVLASVVVYLYTQNLGINRKISEMLVQNTAAMGGVGTRLEVGFTGVSGQLSHQNCELREIKEYCKDIKEEVDRR